MNNLLVVGAGGHGKVVADAAGETGQWDQIAFLDDGYPASSSARQERPVLGKVNQAPEFLDQYPDIIVAVGDNFLRVQLLRYFAKAGFNLAVIVHPAAFASKEAVLEPGSVLFAQTAVNAGAKVGFGGIINTGATVDHDCVLDDGVHLSPGVHLGGTVRVGKYSWLGIGASVIHQLVIGENVIIGAGAAVISNIEDNVTAVGVPARVIKKKRIPEQKGCPA